MIDENLILYLPFDDPDGSKAYDYSQSRADATLSEGAAFSHNAHMGKSLALNGSGEALTAKAIPFNSDFTLMLYVKPTADSVGWVLNSAGVENYIEQWVGVTPGEWVFMAFVKSGATFTVYKESSQVYYGTLTATPIGLSINDATLFGTEAQIDEVRLYDVAKTAQEVLLAQKDSDVEYYIDGVNFKDFGVYVSDSKGIVGRLARKEALTVDWDNYHGIVRDKKRPRFKEREIELSCFIEASSRGAFVEWVQLFFKQFDGEGNHRLKIEYDGPAKPLVYEVELLEDTDVSKKWGSYNEELMVGTFTLKLTEDEPVKRVLRHIATDSDKTAVVTVTSNKLLNIYWGDGTHTYNVHGTATNAAHTYTDNGEYDIVVAGVIEDIELFATNAIIVWNILK